MRYPTNSKVEFKTASLLKLRRDNRKIYYRIVPSELGFFKRIFCNPWRQLYHAFTYVKGANIFYTVKEYNEEIKPLKTFGDVCDYLKEQNLIIEKTSEKLYKEHLEAVANGEEWPD